MASEPSPPALDQVSGQASRLRQGVVRGVGLMAALHPADGCVVLLLGAVFALRVLFLLTNQLQLSADEMYYWDWSRRLDIAYYSKGPIVALLIAVSSHFFGYGQLGVRLPAVILGGLFVLLIYLYGRARLHPWHAFTVAAVAQLLPLLAGLGLAMTTDPPVLVCWAIALMALAPSVRRGTTWAWLVYGLAVGLGLGAKYTTLLLPVSLLLLTPWFVFSRPLLRQWSFWFGQGLALAGLLPMLVWNGRHGWVNLAHNLGHLGASSQFNPAQVLFGPLVLIGTQLLMLGPLTAPMLAVAGWRVVPGAWRRRDPYPLLLAALASLLVLVCVLVSTRRDVYANWPMPLAVIGLLLMIEAWAMQPPSFRDRRWLQVGSALNGLLFAIALLPFYGIRLGLSADWLPTRRLTGWREMVQSLQRQEPQRLAAADVVITDRYTTAAALAHGLQRPPGEVFTVALGKARMNQYDIWARQDLPGRLGADALVILHRDTDPEPLRSLFDRLEQRPQLKVHLPGMQTRRYQVWMARGYNGNPLPQPSRR